MDADDVVFGQAARKLLFGERSRAGDPPLVPAPDRHVRVKVTMNVDGDLIYHFKQRALKEGRPYQLLINEALRIAVEGNERQTREIGDRLLNDSSFIERVAERVANRRTED